MIFLTPNGSTNARAGVTAWILASMPVLAAAALLAATSAPQGRPLFGMDAFLTASALQASARLQMDPALFHPAQLWASSLVHDDWWQLLPVGMLLPPLVLGISTAAGVLVPLVLLTAALPLAALLHATLAQPWQAPGLGPATAVLAGFSLAFVPAARLRIVVVWWAIFAAGWRRLGTMSVARALWILLLIEAARDLWMNDRAALGAIAASALIGVLAGIAARRPWLEP